MCIFVWVVLNLYLTFKCVLVYVCVTACFYSVQTTMACWKGRPAEGEYAEEEYAEDTSQVAAGFIGSSSTLNIWKTSPLRAHQIYL